ncbi:hypothetical protein J7438_12100 [Thalassotalea sp. G20_0]|uniref:hypothetical protein n=1 Tax=Thalassotalea sp. G20_0 TaxID=2821093 RepID=UPI001ADCD97E|nr:hypothetical protein [Thalassotalea sp. G20_0]MBO9494818.1 hypothetical protein [Thalassotalea sp. G20_0]
MDASRAQSVNTPVPSTSAQTRELEPPPDAIVRRRSCQLCGQFIESPPFMVSRCCEHMYHNCCSLATRDVLGCSGCRATYVNFYQDMQFAEEVKKYDWSLFQSATQVAAGKRASTESVIDLTSEETGSLVTIPGPSGLSGPHTQQYVDAGRVSQRDTFKKARLETPEAVSFRADYSVQPAFLPSNNLDLYSMTGTFARLFAEPFMLEEMEALAMQSGYHFVTQMMDAGVVPEWQEICDSKGHLCGKQTNIDQPDETNAFFTAMQHHLDQLAPSHRLFVTFVCSFQNKITGLPQQLSPVSQVFRHPSDNRLIWLTTTDEPIAKHPHGRLIFGVFASGTQLVKYLRFLILTSEADQVMFVRSTNEGESDADGLDNINIREFIQRFPPRDMGVGGQSKNYREILLAAAQSLGMQRIQKEDASKVVLLDKLIDGKFRNTQLTVKDLMARLNDLDYFPEHDEIIRSRLKLSQGFGREETQAENIRLQRQVADCVKKIHGSLATTGYIQIQLEPWAFALPNEILVLACDEDQLYLVNMKRKSVSVQCSSSIDDITDFCQVFMSGCRIREAYITLFLPKQAKNASAPK